MTAPALHTAPRRAAVAFVFVTVVLDMLALGLIVPVLPKLVIGFMGGDTGRAAPVFGLLLTVWALMQFLFSPVLGALSDRFGRRPIILLSNGGMALAYAATALAPNLGWLVVARVISGITAASVATAGAYIADVTAPERRAAAFGLIGAASGFGFVLGPAMGGILGDIGPRLPFWVAAGLSFANACYGLLVLPESLTAARRARFTWARANPVGALLVLRSTTGLSALASVSFLYALAHMALNSTFVLYATYRYGWDAREVGLVLAAFGVCSMVVQAGLVRPVVARFGERRVLLAGLLFGIVGFVIFAFADTGAIFCVSIPVMSLWGLVPPSAQGLMTRRVPTTEQGRLQGALASLAGIAGLIGPAVFTLIFAQGVALGPGWRLPGAPFLVSASLLALAAVLGWRVTGVAQARPISSL